MKLFSYLLIIALVCATSAGVSAQTSGSKGQGTGKGQSAAKGAGTAGRPHSSTNSKLSKPAGAKPGGLAQKIANIDAKQTAKANSITAKQAAKEKWKAATRSAKRNSKLAAKTGKPERIAKVNTAVDTMRSLQAARMQAAIQRVAAGQGQIHTEVPGVVLSIVLGTVQMGTPNTDAKGNTTTTWSDAPAKVVTAVGPTGEVFQVKLPIRPSIHIKPGVVKF
jgi:hypothetical protein